MRFLTFTSLTTFKSCESRDNEIVTDLLTTPNTLRENSHGCHGIVNTLRDSVVTIVTDRIVTVCFDPHCVVTIVCDNCIKSVYALTIVCDNCIKCG